MLTIAEYIKDIGSSGSPFSYKAGNNGDNKLTLSHAKDMTAFGLKIHRSNVSTKEDALEVFNSCAEAITTLSTARATTASEFNRLMSMLDYELDSVEKTDVSIGQITDAQLALSASEVAQSQARADVSMASFGQARNINIEFIKGVI